MPSEQHVRKQIVSMLRTLDAMPVENAVYPGTPDVECTAGWVEVKVLPRALRGSGTVRVPLLRPEQRAWLRRRCASGGRAWILLVAGPEWWLLPGLWAAEHLGRCDRGEIQANSAAYWPRQPAAGELVAELKG